MRQKSSTSHVKAREGATSTLGLPNFQNEMELRLYSDDSTLVSSAKDDIGQES
jgi:hypothetical protein